MTEDFCGVEPITHPPIELETRAPPLVDQDKLRKAYNHVDSAILGGLCISFFFFFIKHLIMFFKIYRSFGTYIFIACNYGNFNWSIFIKT